MSAPLSVGDDKDSVSLGSKIRVYFDRPMPEYDVPPLKAYAAVSSINDVMECYALVCERALLPRISQIEKYVQMNNPALTHLVGNGVVYWPLAKEDRYIFVYETRPGVVRLEDSRDNVALGLDPNTVMQKIIPVFVSLLQDLEHKQLYHGAFYLSNIYAQYEEDELIDIVLGDSLALPCSYAQPQIYKTAPRSLAEPNGCGAGTIADDIYAFGVCIAQMLRQKNPMAGKSDEDILHSKMQVGTYATLIDKERFSGAFLELLKGVLQDDPAKRWNAEEISLWFDGRQLSPKQQALSKIAPRPLEFDNKKYEQVTMLAKDLKNSPTSAMHLIESGQMLHWIDRSLGDKRISERFVRALSQVRDNLKTQEKTLLSVTNVAMGLNPANPIMYKGHSIYPGAIGEKLIELVERGEDLNPIIDMISLGVVETWLSFQLEKGGADFMTVLEAFEACRAALKGKKTGYGIERCIYRLSKRAHCMSPIFKDVYVLDSSDVVIKLDELLEKNPKAAGFLMDRHIAAFLVEREPQVIDTRLFDLDSPHPNEVIHAVLSCYAAIQKRHKIDALPYLAKAFLKHLSPCYHMFYDHRLRETIEDKVKKAADQGDLPEMLAIIEDPITISRDRKAYNNALQEYHKLDKEYQEIKMNLIDRSNFNKHFGREISAMIASGISVVIIIFVAITYYTTSG